MSEIITPQVIESRLKALSKEVDASHAQLVEAETKYFRTKAEWEIAMATTRLDLARRSAPNGKNYTVGEREDLAIITNDRVHLDMAAAEALVRAARGNAQRVRTQVDIARSIGTSVRTSMDLL